VLAANRPALDALASALRELETLDRDAVDAVVAKAQPQGLRDVRAMSDLVRRPLAELASELPYFLPAS